MFVTHSINDSRLSDGDDGACDVPIVLGANKQNFSQIRPADSDQTSENSDTNSMTSLPLSIPSVPSTRCSTSLAIPLLMNLSTWYGAR